MRALRKHKFSKLYEMSSGISTKPEQAGHGAPFLSFSTVFAGHFLPPALPDQMDTSDKEQETYSIKRGDIFLTRTSETLDELGMSSVATCDYPKATYSGFLKRLRPTQSDQSCHKFMAFYLRSKTFRKAMDNNAVMTLRCSLNEQIFSYLDLLLPEFDEQVKTGDFLYLIHQKIELNNQINAELEAMAKLLYDYWFVQFDFPMTATQAASLDRPDLEGKPYKSSGGKMVHNPTLKRLIPDQWKVGTLLDVATYTNGIACQKYRPKAAEQLPVIKIKEMRDGFTRSTEFVSPDIPEKIKIKDGDVLFSWSASLEVIIWAGGSGALNQHIFKVASKSYPRAYFYHELRNYLSHFKMLADLRKTTMGHITQEHLEQSRISIPTDDIVKSFNAVVNPLLEAVVNNKKQNQELTQLRDWLLPMLMNGQVTIQ